MYVLITDRFTGHYGEIYKVVVSTGDTYHVEIVWTHISNRKSIIIFQEGCIKKFSTYDKAVKYKSML